jgi:hypothetical protein
MFRDRFAEGVPSNAFLKWPEFLRKNARWIALEEISVAQATGKAPLASYRVEAITRSRLLVVAVHRGCPISYNGEKITGRDEKKTAIVRADVALAAPSPMPNAHAAAMPSLGFPGKSP